MQNIRFSYRFNFLALMVFLLVGLSSCVKESVETTTNSFQNEPQRLLTTTVYGRVIDDNGAAIANATVNYEYL